MKSAEEIIAIITENPYADASNVKVLDKWRAEIEEAQRKKCSTALNNIRRKPNETAFEHFQRMIEAVEKAGKTEEKTNDRKT